MSTCQGEYGNSIHTLVFFLQHTCMQRHFVDISTSDPSRLIVIAVGGRIWEWDNLGIQLLCTMLWW